MAEVGGDEQFNTTRSFEASIHASLIRKSKSEPKYTYDSEESSVDRTCSEQCLGFMKSTKFLLCTSHTLASWGNRMWSFAVGLFMIYLSKTSLRLTAIYGFVLGGAIMLFGPIMGDMVDHIPRLKYARNVLFVIDSSIALSAVAVCLTVYYNAQIILMWHGWALTLCHVIIVFFAVLSNTASVGRMIAIERDWIVVMVKDKYELTALSALLRRIDLVTNLLAPVVTGQLFTYGSIVMCSIFIAAWNVAFVFVEYLLLYIIYKRVPELAIDKQPAPQEEEEDEKTPLLGSNTLKSGKSNMATSQMSKTARKKKSSMKHWCSRAFSVFIAFFRGWKVYAEEETVLAGLALGFTFMTVLGFDNVTTGFAIQEGLTSSVFGIMSGIGSLVGVLGTIAFPLCRKKIGLLKTGIFAFCLELLLLVPCVISIFAPGTIFQYDFLWNRPTKVNPFPSMSPTAAQKFNISTSTAAQQYGMMSTTPPTTMMAVSHLSTSALYNLNNPVTGNTSALLPVGGSGSINATSTPLLSSTATLPTSTVSRPSTTTTSTYSTHLASVSTSNPITGSTTKAPYFPPPKSYWSVGLLMFGIITSRCGLWMADLTVTQLLIETPKDHERGVVNGVQNAINRTWDLTKFLLVVLLPWPQTFGYLIILTFLFILMALLLFMAFSYKARKYGYKVMSDEVERESKEAKEREAEKQRLRYRPKPQEKFYGSNSNIKKGVEA